MADGQAEPLELAIGIAHNLAFLLLLFVTAGLYIDAGLQVVYVGLPVYGLIVPWWDTATTVLSFLASYGQTRKLCESWWFWIAANVVDLPLYGYKGLWVTAVVYGVFLALCVRSVQLAAGGPRRACA